MMIGIVMSAVVVLVSTAGSISPVMNDAPAAYTARNVERRFIQNATYGCRVKLNARSPMERLMTRAMNQKGVKKAFVVVIMVVSAAEAAGTNIDDIIATMIVGAILFCCMSIDLRFC